MTRCQRLACMLMIPSIVAAADPKPSLTAPYVALRVQAGKDGASATLAVQATDFSAEVLTKQQVEIKPLIPEDPAVACSTANQALELVTKTDTAAFWLQTVKITGWQPQGRAKCRFALMLGSVLQNVEVTLSDKEEAAVNWTWRTPAAWHTIVSQSLPLTASLTSGSVSGIRLAQASLERNTNPKLVLHADEFQLCANPDQPAAEKECASVSAAVAPSLSTVYLRLAPTAKVPPGEYTGKVLLTRDKDGTGNEVDVKLYVTSHWWQALGMLALLVGWALYFLASVFGVWRRARAARIRVALLLAREAAKLLPRAETILKAVSASSVLTAVRLKVADIQGTLATHNLELPEFTNLEAGQADFNQRIEAQSKRVASLAIIIDRAMPQIASATRLAAGDPVKLGKVEKAGIDLVHLTDDEHTRAKLLELIGGITSKLFADLNVAPLGGSAFGGDFAGELEHVEVTLATWTGLSVLAWLVLSLVVGALAMIVPKAGFGTAEDLARCLLWGAGLPVVGDGLQKLTTTGIAPSFGVKIPKVGG